MNACDTSLNVRPNAALYLIAIYKHPSSATAIADAVKIIITHTLPLKCRRIHAAQFVQGKELPGIIEHLRHGDLAGTQHLRASNAQHLLRPRVRLPRKPFGIAGMRWHLSVH